ncbi:MAG: chromate transporter [Clostridiales bacterium]|nr:chromate transporter [Clostridiales bacterium]
MKIALKLFLIFFKIGAFTFGGGYAMIPIIQKEIVEKRKWVTDRDILDIVTIAESTPGAIAINTSTFVGYKIAGFWGAVLATFGAVVPSFLIITAVSYLLRNFSEYRGVKYAFFGIRAGIIGLMIKSLVSMYKQLPKGVIVYVFMAATFIIATFTKVSVIYILIGAATFGLVSSLLVKRRAKS